MKIYLRYIPWKRTDGDWIGYLSSRGMPWCQEKPKKRKIPATSNREELFKKFAANYEIDEECEEVAFIDAKDKRNL